MKERCLLRDTLCDPTIAGHFVLLDWDLLLRQARSANLLAHLGVLLEQQLEPAATVLPGAPWFVMVCRLSLPEACQDYHYTIPRPHRAATSNAR